MNGTLYDTRGDGGRGIHASHELKYARVKAAHLVPQIESARVMDCQLFSFKKGNTTLSAKRDCGGHVICTS